MAFDAGAIVGRMLLDKTQWNASVVSVGRDQEKMRSGFASFVNSMKENWLGTAALIAAGAVVARQAWATMEAGVKADQVEAGFMNIANSAGIAGKKLKEALKEASAFTVEFSDIASTTSALIGRSLSESQITSLMQVARAEARKTGETVEQAYNTIANSVTGGFTRALKTAYGVNVDATVAVANYARATGMTTEKVEQFYKSQAIANEILKQTKGDLDSLSSTQLTHYERIQQMQARYKEFSETVGKHTYNVLVILGSISGIIMASVLSVIDNTMSAIQRSFAFVIGMMQKLVSLIPGVGNALDGLRKQFDASADSFNEKAQNNLKQVGAYYEEIVGAVKDMVSDTSDSANGLFGNVKSNAEDMTVGVKQTVDQWLAQMKQDFNGILEFTQGIFTGLQSNFKTIVADGIRGDLSSMKSYFVSFGNMVIDVIAEIIAKWMAMKVVTGFAGIFAGAWGSGGAENIMATGANIGMTAGYAEGIDYVPEAGNYKLHEGEKVVPKYDAAKNESQAVTIYNLITPEAVAAAMSGKEGNGVIINVVNQNSLRNGVIRREVKRR
jgi:phage gp36-like protein